MSIENSRSRDSNSIPAKLWGLGPEGIMSAALVVVVATGLIYLAYFGILRHRSISDSPDTWGTFGSYFQGVAGSLLAFLGMWLVAHSLRASLRDLESTQHQTLRQLALTEKQLEANIEQMKDQRIATFLEVGERLGALLEEKRVGLRIAFESIIATGTNLSFLPSRANISLQELVDELGKRPRNTTSETNGPWSMKVTGAEVDEIEKYFEKIGTDNARQLHRLCAAYGRLDRILVLISKKIASRAGEWFEQQPIYLGFEEDDLRYSVETLGMIMGTLPPRLRSSSGQREFVGVPERLQKLFGRVTVA